MPSVSYIGLDIKERWHSGFSCCGYSTNTEEIMRWYIIMGILWLLILWLFPIWLFH